jgi:hypothetical protein
MPDTYLGWRRIRNPSTGVYGTTPLTIMAGRAGTSAIIRRPARMRPLVLDTLSKGSDQKLA